MACGLGQHGLQSNLVGLLDRAKCILDTRVVYNTPHLLCMHPNRTNK